MDMATHGHKFILSRCRKKSCSYWSWNSLVSVGSSVSVSGVLRGKHIVLVDTSGDTPWPMPRI